MIRHIKYGILQGPFMRHICWYPYSKMPQAGILALPSVAEANNLIKLFCTSSKFSETDFDVVPFDEELNTKLNLYMAFYGPWTELYSAKKKHNTK